MNVINFSHNYYKLWDQTTAKLIAVEDIEINDSTNEDLLEYNTKIVDGTYYLLKNGKYIQLIFLGDKGIPFCTIRPAYNKFGDKKKYYTGKIGEQFIIKIKES